MHPRAHRAGPSGCHCSLLAHVQLVIDQNPQIPSCGAALQPFITLSVRLAMVVPSQVQNLTFALVKFDAVGDCPAFPPSKKSTGPPNLV